MTVPDKVMLHRLTGEVMAGQNMFNDGVEYIRADLSSPLGAVAMRDAAIEVAEGWYDPDHPLCGQIRALPLPTHAALLAHAMRLPEVAAMVEALHFYADFYENPNEGPWGVNSDDFGKVARTALEGKT